MYYDRNNLQLTMSYLLSGTRIEVSNELWGNADVECKLPWFRDEHVEETMNFIVGNTSLYVLDHQTRCRSLW